MAINPIVLLKTLLLESLLVALRTDVLPNLLDREYTELRTNRELAEILLVLLSL
jgi:hypothetical protein